MARHSLPKGTIIEGIEEILVELPVKETRVQAEEQLEELSRADEIFLECSSYGIEEEILTIRYHLPKGYKGLSSWTGLSQEQKQEIAKNILRIRRIEGSQFTTYVDPVNIYADESGDVKFAHRGIRAVLPPEQHESKVFVYRLKCLIISLFTTHTFEDLIERGLGELQSDEGLTGALFAAKSLDELEAALAEIYPAPVPVKKPEPEALVQQEAPIQPATPVYQQAPQAPQQAQAKTQEAPKKPAKKSYMTLIGSIVAGLLIGVILTYSVLADRASSQVSQVTAQSSDEVAALETEKEELQTTVSSQDQSLEAYRLLGVGERDQAIEAFESMGDLTDQDKESLKRLYIGHDNPEVVVKAASLDGAYAADTASRLVALNSDAARETLMTIESKSPYVQLEQAWNDRQFERVHELANGELSDSERAQKLSAESYYQEDNLDEAWKKSNELEDIGLKIRIKEKDIKKVEDDDDLDDDEKKDEIDKLNDDISDLKDQQD
ncbi:type VII secretion protein EssB/YukC [Alkalicoccobacillus plakortidis]|uniref:Type VII secretion protein EssB n=1 Tax=Alkalicoccobacillus plakortidis TaxID=444060 RepID=A0ABT0XN23_9BACI|nr:type VII secretion protein EssB/YukC [Alkalicoccobacillus plakortidis]MCM2677115.1 hypothetical protein [Alkalicoccobacillus plakortidis]